jgi:MFS family permease
VQNVHINYLHFFFFSYYEARRWLVFCRVSTYCDLLNTFISALILCAFPLRLELVVRRRRFLYSRFLFCFRACVVLVACFRALCQLHLQAAPSKKKKKARGRTVGRAEQNDFFCFLLLTVFFSFSLPSCDLWGPFSAVGVVGAVYVACASPGSLFCHHRLHTKTVLASLYGSALYLGALLSHWVVTSLLFFFSLLALRYDKQRVFFAVAVLFCLFVCLSRSSYYHCNTPGLIVKKEGTRLCTFLSLCLLFLCVHKHVYLLCNTTDSLCKPLTGAHPLLLQPHRECVFVF